MKLKRVLFLSIAATASLSLTSCLNDDNDPGEVRNGFFSIVNAMPDTAALDFYIQRDHLGDAAVSYKDAYPSSSYLKAASPYNYLLEVAYPDDDQAIFNGQIPVQPDTYFSIYIYNDNDEIKGVLLEDDLESPEAGNARVRFINLGTDAPNVDLVAEGETAPWVTDLMFAGNAEDNTDVIEDSQEVAAGSYMLQVKDNETGDILASSSVQLEDSKVYTLWVSGMYEGTGQRAMGLETIEHEEVEATTPAP